MWEGRAGFEITCMSRGPLGLRAGTSGCREVSLELWGEVPAGCGFGSCGLLDGEGSRTGVVDRRGRYSSWGLQQGRPTQILSGCGGLDTGRWKGCSIGGHDAPATTEGPLLSQASHCDSPLLLGEAG